MTYQVTHITEYEYHQPVTLCHNVARLQMRETGNQHCRNIQVSFAPHPEIVEEFEDNFGNRVMYFAIQHEHRHLKVTVETTVDKTPNPHLRMNLYDNLSWEEARKLIDAPGTDHFDARQFTHHTPITKPTAAINQYALLSFTPGRSIFDAAHDLMHRIYRDFQFKPGFTTVATPLAEVMKTRKGVCQDFAHLAIACVRSVGLPARYMSGYIETLPPPGKTKLTGVDASHAWFAIYIPQSGWHEFDPTNNQVPGEQHLTIGWGRDYTDVAPLKGVIVSSGKHHLKVSVDVRRM